MPDIIGLLNHPKYEDDNQVPTPSGAYHFYLFAKADGLYLKDANGVVTGPLANSSETETYVFAQQVSASVWTITHHKGSYPSVTVVDSAGTVVYGEVQYLDENTVRVIFSSEFSGTAYLN